MTEQITMRVRDRRAIQRELKHLELEYDEFFDCYPYELHEALIRVGLDNPDLVLQKLKETQNA